MIAVPGDSLDIILRHAPAGGVPHPEVFLRFVVALRSGEAEPGDRFGIIRSAMARCASTICARRSSVDSADQASARLYHLRASTSSCGTPSPAV